MWPMVSLFPFHILPVNLEDPILGAHILSRNQVKCKGVKTPDMEIVARLQAMLADNF